MTPCWICSTPIEVITLDPRDRKIMPCSECRQIIYDTFSSFYKTQEAADDAAFEAEVQET